MTVPYTTVGGILLAYAAATVAAKSAGALVRRLLRGLAAAGDAVQAGVASRATRLVSAFTWMVYGIATAVAASLLLERLELSDPSLSPRIVVRWLLAHGVNIVIIAVGASIVVRAADLAIEQLQHSLSRRHAEPDLEWQRRASTISGILARLVNASVVFVAALMLLRELSIDIVPILTGAGIVGLAVGFGAQNLVRDVISGFFMILEDQVRVGDQARVNGIAGTVEQINLRTIVVRDNEGAVQVFPNGTITTLANLSKQFSYATVDVRVTYGEDLDRVLSLLSEVGAAMEADSLWRGVLMAPLEISGVESLAGTYAVVQIKFRTRPLSQGRVASELRKRVVQSLVAQRVRPYGR
jgi:small-conductance mechanosensitive channel